MKPFNKEAILLLIANPVDILAYFALQYSGLPATQVIGSGTFLDSARLRGALAAKANVAASSIDAFVIGEHGESQVVTRILNIHLLTVALNQWSWVLPIRSMYFRLF